MREADAQLVLLVKAFEEADGEGVLLPLRDRTRATEQARAKHGAVEAEAASAKLARPARNRAADSELLLSRSRLLLPTLEAEVPQLQGVLSASRLGAGLLPLVAVLALLLGLGTNALGEQGRLHVLFAPLLLLVAWNLAVYPVLFVLAVRAVFARRKSARAARAATAGDEAGRAAAPPAASAVVAGARSLGGVVGRWAGWLVERSLSRARVRQVRHQALIGAALTRFAQAWRAAAVPLIAARLHLMLHVGALLLVLGAVVGMYVRGLGLRYIASWESTFLDAGQVQAVLSAVLGPAARLLGTEVPDVTGLDSGEGGPAAPWIHLYALTAALAVLLPRAMLALVSARRAGRLSRNLALGLEGAWFRRLLAPGRGRAARVDVQPYALRLDPRGAERLLALLHDLFGTQAEVVQHGSLPYGGELPPLPASAAAERCRVLVFSGASSPESEVHGRLAAELARACSPDERLIVAVDDSAYARTVGAHSPRLSERRMAWDRVLREAGVTSAHLMLDAEPGPAALEALAAALHPAPTSAAGRGA